MFRKFLSIYISYYIHILRPISVSFFNETATPEIYTYLHTLSLHDALPISFFLLIINVSYAFFDTFAIIDIMTQGGPGNSTSILVYEVYNAGDRKSTRLNSSH